MRGLRGLCISIMTVNEGELFQALGRLEGKVDILLKGLPDIEKRVRALENWKWMLLGGASVVAILASFVTRLFVK